MPRSADAASAADERVRLNAVSTPAVAGAVVPTHRPSRQSARSRPGPSGAAMRAGRVAARGRRSSAQAGSSASGRPRRAAGRAGTSSRRWPSCWRVQVWPRSTVPPRWRTARNVSGASTGSGVTPCRSWSSRTRRPRRRAERAKRALLPDLAREEQRRPGHVVRRRPPHLPAGDVEEEERRAGRPASAGRAIAPARQDSADHRLEEARGVPVVVVHLLAERRREPRRRRG